MKIEFEGTGLYEVIVQMEQFIMDAMPNTYVGSEGYANPEDGEPDLDKTSETEQASPKPAPKKTRKKAAKKADPVPVVPETGEPQNLDSVDVVESTTTDETLPPSDAKKEAIELLMQLYNDGKATEVKSLLTEFGVKKFAELPDDKGHALLKRATEIGEAE